MPVKGVGEEPAVSTRGSEKPEPFRMHKARSHNSTANEGLRATRRGLSLHGPISCTWRAFASSMVAACRRRLQGRLQVTVAVTAGEGV